MMSGVCVSVYVREKLRKWGKKHTHSICMRSKIKEFINIYTYTYTKNLWSTWTSMNEYIQQTPNWKLHFHFVFLPFFSLKKNEVYTYIYYLWIFYTYGMWAQENAHAHTDVCTEVQFFLSIHDIQLEVIPFGLLCKLLMFTADSLFWLISPFTVPET